MRIGAALKVGVVAFVGSMLACSGGVDSASEASRSTRSAIIGGTRASSYEEAALVGMYQNGQLYAYCSASVIAPKVVLTAGHCVDGTTAWVIKTPYASGQSAHASSGATFDWAENGATTVNPNHHDIGLIFLDTPITLTQYPVLATQPLADGKTVVNIGRINNGTLSTTDLYVSPAIPIHDGAADGFPFDYGANDVIESGDSGGPDEVLNTTPHLIVAVNSGAGSGSEVLARVDLLNTWILGQIASHGGGGGGSPPPVDAGSAPPPPPPDAGGGGGGGGGHDAGSGGGAVDSGGGAAPGDPPATDTDAGSGGSGASPEDVPFAQTSRASGCAMSTTTATASDTAILALAVVLLAGLGARARRRRARHAH